MVRILIFFVLCSAGVVFFVWLFIKLYTPKSHNLERGDRLSGMRDAVQRLSNDVQLLSTQLGTTPLMREITAEGARKWWESEAHYLERRLRQLELVVAALRKRAAEAVRRQNQRASR